ncbi:hypothetical protein NCC49_002454 [Naganishia albida]|nr:hypothetical protein NCC49_002454 [Naganishia albida]
MVRRRHNLPGNIRDREDQAQRESLRRSPINCLPQATTTTCSTTIRQRRSGSAAFVPSDGEELGDDYDFEIDEDSDEDDEPEDVEDLSEDEWDEPAGEPRKTAKKTTIINNKLTKRGRSGHLPPKAKLAKPAEQAEERGRGNPKTTGTKPVKKALHDPEGSSGRIDDDRVGENDLINDKGEEEDDDSDQEGDLKELGKPFDEFEWHDFAGNDVGVAPSGEQETGIPRS